MEKFRTPQEFAEWKLSQSFWRKIVGMLGVLLSVIAGLWTSPFIGLGLMGVIVLLVLLHTVWQTKVQTEYFRTR